MINAVTYTNPFTNVFRKGFRLGWKSFWKVFPFGLTIAGISNVIQIPTFTLVDIFDWVSVFSFFMGILVLSSMHASIIASMHAIKTGRTLTFFESIKKGMNKSLRVFIVSVFYSSIVIVGLALFVIPGIYMGVMLYFSLFLVILNKYKQSLPIYHKVLNYFLDSWHLVWGHWWLTLSIIIISSSVLVAFEYLLLIMMPYQVILSHVICITLLAMTIPFWYGLILSLLFELKKEH